MTRGPARTPPSGSAVDRLAALVERSIADLSGEIARVQSFVVASEVRTSKDTRDLLDEFRRESDHLNQRMERFHEAAQLGIEQVRQELKAHEKAALEGAARGAAEGASKAVGESAAGVAAIVASGAKGFWSTATGKIVAFSVSFTAVVAAIKNVPSFIQWVDWAWNTLRGMKP